MMMNTSFRHIIQKCKPFVHLSRNYATLRHFPAHSTNTNWPLMQINIVKPLPLNGMCFRPLSQQQTTDAAGSSKTGKFDETCLKYIVCPLTKKPLRYDKEKEMLISDEIDVGYRIVHGIPNLVPKDAVMLKKKQDANTDSSQ